MNVASLELCEELYALSGWTEVDTQWRRYKDIEGWRDWHWYLDSRGAEWDSDYCLPAYDLGYLLRKLPDICMLWRQYNIWHCDCEDAVMCEADTPEGAAAKLAIELFKQGVLVREAA